MPFLGAYLLYKYLAHPWNVVVPSCMIATLVLGCAAYCHCVRVYKPPPTPQTNAEEYRMLNIRC